MGAQVQDSFPDAAALASPSTAGRQRCGLCGPWVGLEVQQSLDLERRGHWRASIDPVAIVTRWAQRWWQRLLGVCGHIPSGEATSENLMLLPSPDSCPLRGRKGKTGDGSSCRDRWQSRSSLLAWHISGLGWSLSPSSQVRQMPSLRLLPHGWWQGERCVCP